MQLLVGELGDFAAVGFEDDRSLVGIAVLQVAVETIVGGVQLAIVEPFVERCLALVQGFGERFVPGEVLACQIGPEPLIVAFGIPAHGVVRIHAGEVRVFGEFDGRREYAGFLFLAFDIRHGVSLLMLILH